jgi:hypothetical protein
VTLYDGEQSRSGGCRIASKDIGRGPDYVSCCISVQKDSIRSDIRLHCSGTRCRLNIC